MYIYIHIYIYNYIYMWVINHLLTAIRIQVHTLQFCESWLVPLCILVRSPCPRCALIQRETGKNKLRLKISSSNQQYGFVYKNKAIPTFDIA